MVTYKVIQKKVSFVKGEERTPKYFASVENSGTKTLTQLGREIEKISAVSRADVQSVLISLVEVATASLENGQIVRLGELGSLRISVKSEGKDTEKEVTAEAIKKAKIIFSPGKELKELTKKLQFIKK